MKDGTSFWFPRPEVLLRRASWNDQHIVFQVPSGETHYLNAVSVALLDRLNRPTKTTAIVDDLRRHLGLPEDNAEFAGQVARVLVRFNELGLIGRSEAAAP
uniref:Uncharacterized protein n=1 Tax=uncultured microorganism TaxID=358574 RepID=F8UHU0_9ZZZZ|nr:conserved hypothetical protein [uncultured microorganism]